MGELPRLEDRYRLGPELGRGGFGSVYRGEPVDGGAPVAVKLAHATLEGAQRARILREARLVAGLRHPRLARFEGCFDGPDGRLALVYELVPGRSLEAIRGAGPMDLARALAYAADLAEGLAALHGAGLVHRDLKPENAIEGADGRLKLIDFGLARAFESGSTLTDTGVVMGTPHYMAPEQIEARRVGPATDVYALACMVFELLTGRTPFEGPASQIVQGHLARDPPRLGALRPGLPGAVGKVLAAALAKDPGSRPATARALVDALEQAAAVPDAPAARTEILDPGGPDRTRSLGGPGGHAPARKGPTGRVSAVLPRPPAPEASLGSRPALRVGAGLLLGVGLVVGLALLGARSGEDHPATPSPAAPAVPPASPPRPKARLLTDAGTFAWLTPEPHVFQGRARGREFFDRLANGPIPLGPDRFLFVARDKAPEADRLEPGHTAAHYEVILSDPPICRYRDLSQVHAPLRQAAFLAPAAAPGTLWYFGQFGLMGDRRQVRSPKDPANVPGTLLLAGSPATPERAALEDFYPEVPAKPFGNVWAALAKAPVDGKPHAVLVRSRSGEAPTLDLTELAPFTWGLGPALGRTSQGWYAMVASTENLEGRRDSRSLESALVGLASGRGAPRFLRRRPGKPPAFPASWGDDLLLVEDGKLLRLAGERQRGDLGAEATEPLQDLPAGHAEFASPEEDSVAAVLHVREPHLHLVSTAPGDAAASPAGGRLRLRWLRFRLASLASPPEDLSFDLPTPFTKAPERYRSMREGGTVRDGRLLFLLAGQSERVEHLVLLDLEAGTPAAAKVVEPPLIGQKPVVGAEPRAIERPEALYALMASRDKPYGLGVWRLPWAALE